MLTNLDRPHVPQMNSPISVLKSSDSLGWNTILVEHVRFAADELYVSHLEDLRICMVLDPDYTLEQSRNRKNFVHTFQPGESQLLPKETSGFWRSDQTVELLHVQFSASFLEGVAAQQGWTSNHALEILDQFLLQDGQMAHIAYALFAELHEDGSSGRLYSESLATALATYILRKYAAVPLPATALPPVSRHELKRALEYMHEHLTEEIALETLAQLVNLSPSHFNALFKEQIGVAPYRYILQQRISRARELLLHSDFSIAQVAAEVGFYDQSHLTRHMRQLLGVTPAALRHQQNIPNRR